MKMEEEDFSSLQNYVVSPSEIKSEINKSETSSPQPCPFKKTFLSSSNSEEINRSKDNFERGSDLRLSYFNSSRYSRDMTPAVTTGHSTCSQFHQRRTPTIEVSETNLWWWYCRIITVFVWPELLTYCGIRSPYGQRAWREKIGIISIIVLVSFLVSFFTFGFSTMLCNESIPRIHYLLIPLDSVIIHGRLFNITNIVHPKIMLQPFGGSDVSFLFQNVNGYCQEFLHPSNKSQIFHDSSGHASSYFPCDLLAPAGNPNATDDLTLFPHWASHNNHCHNSNFSRQSLYNINPSGMIFYNWKDISMAPNLVVYHGDVLDIGRIELLHNSGQWDFIEPFEYFMSNITQNGSSNDISNALVSNMQLKRLGKCLVQLSKVGVIESESIGCIAAKVILLVSLILIIGIIFIKFLFALYFLGSFEINNDLFQFFLKKGNIMDVSPNILEANLPISTSNKKNNNHILGEKLPESNSASISNNSIEATLSHPSLSMSHHSSLQSHGSKWKNPTSAAAKIENIICLMTAYSESENHLRESLDSLAYNSYPSEKKLIIVVCDGLVTGQGNERSTPDIVLSMMNMLHNPETTKSLRYISIGSEDSRFNEAKVYYGYYKTGISSMCDSSYDSSEHSLEDTMILKENLDLKSAVRLVELNTEVENYNQCNNSQNSLVTLPSRSDLLTVPMITIVKGGLPGEYAWNSKTGNRGKRDSHIILMSFLSKALEGKRLTELECELYYAILQVWKLDVWDIDAIVMVDADTRLEKDALSNICDFMSKDRDIMGCCGETRVQNKNETWVTMIQVFEYFISHRLNKSFESFFGGVTCLPGCFCMYRIKVREETHAKINRLSRLKNKEKVCVRSEKYQFLLPNEDIVVKYSNNKIDTLHEKNLLLLGEDRFLSTLMLKTFPSYKLMFNPKAICRTIVPTDFKSLMDQRRRWINSTLHNLYELLWVQNLCGVLCFSMQMVIFIELIGTVSLPMAMICTIFLIFVSITATPIPVIPLFLLALILGLPGLMVLITAHSPVYIGWMLVYLCSLPIWNFILPLNAYDFTWGITREIEPTVVTHSCHHPREDDIQLVSFKQYLISRQERQNGITITHE